MHTAVDARAGGAEAKEEAVEADTNAAGGTVEEDEAVTTIVRLLTQAAEAEEGQGGATRLCSLADTDGNCPLHNVAAAVPKLACSVRLVQLLLSFHVQTDPANKAKQTPLKMVETTERLYSSRDAEVAARARAIRELLKSAEFPDTPRGV